MAYVVCVGFVCVCRLCVGCVLRVRLFFVGVCEGCAFCVGIAPLV